MSGVLPDGETLVGGSAGAGELIMGAGRVKSPELPPPALLLPAFGLFPLLLRALLGAGTGAGAMEGTKRGGAVRGCERRGVEKRGCATRGCAMRGTLAIRWLLPLGAFPARVGALGAESVRAPVAPALATGAAPEFKG